MVSSSDSSFASAPDSRLLIRAILSLIRTKIAVVVSRVGMRIGALFAESP